VNCAEALRFFFVKVLKGHQFPLSSVALVGVCGFARRCFTLDAATGRAGIA